VEVWNLVFTQFNRKPDGTLAPLPRKNIDTGMGLERLNAVMQGVESNFETELFVPIIEEVKTYAKQYNKEALNAIADHSRAITFAIYDGVIPSNEQRGYVVRKLIRKTAFLGDHLGIHKPFIYKLVPVVAQTMRTPYPELAKRREEISRIILAEEKNFSSILNNAEKLFSEKFKDYLCQKEKYAQGTGLLAFELYDTYGVPIEVTQSWLNYKGIELSLEEFNQRLNQQKELSKKASSMQGEVFDLSIPHFKIEPTPFLGYRQYSCRAKIKAILKADKLVSYALPEEEVKLILDKTVFYAQAGGQVGDTGVIKSAKAEFLVTDSRYAIAYRQGKERKVEKER